MRAKRRRPAKTADFSGHAVQPPLFARVCERTTRSSAIPPPNGAHRARTGGFVGDLDPVGTRHIKHLCLQRGRKEK